MRHVLAALAGLLLASPAFAGMPASVSQNPPAGDMANAVVSGTFTGTGKSASFTARGSFNVLIYGSSGPNGSWNGSVQVERSFDGGTTWVVAGISGAGQQAIFNTPNQDVSIVGNEPERGVLYRLDCTSYTSGTINYRLSTTAGSSPTYGQ